MAVKTIKMTVEKKELDLYITNLTETINKAIVEHEIKEGSVTIYVPGSTASVTTIEYEPNLIRDLNKMLERITPSDIDYEHHKTWGESNGKSHLRSALFGTSLTIPFIEGKLPGDQWQQVVLLDFDVRTRKRDILIQLMW